MKKYIEKVLRQKVEIEVNKNIYAKLPLAYKGKYSIYNVRTNGILWMAIEPKKSIGLVELRKDRLLIEKIENLNCAIFLNEATFYIKEKMLDEGIPFVLRDKQVFLPFIGYLLSNNSERELKPVYLISYLTQKMILLALYEKWENMTVTDISKKLNVSKMSVSRCFDEVEYLGIDILGKKGKSRVITAHKDTKEHWHEIKPFLRNPVITRYEFIEDVNLEKIAGVSALCEYSLLSDNEYKTYAITKKELKSAELKSKKQAGRGEPIGSVVLELGYFIDFNGKGVEDPLSVALSVSEAEKEDERINISIKEMLEGHVW